MNRLALCSLSAAGVLFSAGAWAGDNPHAGHAVPSSPHAELQMMDADKDGRISAEEHALGAKSMFDAMDTDKDSVVTAAEMDAAHQASTKAEKESPQKLSSAEMIKVVDTNGDGKLSSTEHVAGAKTMFAKMDTDGDGWVDAAELDAGHKTRLSTK